MDTFSRVFVPKAECTQVSSTNKCIQYQILDGAKFSNHNLDVVLEDKNDKSFYGKRYSIGVLGHRLKCPLALGMTAKLDPDTFEMAFKSHVNAAKEYFGLNEADPKDKKILERLTSAIRESKLYMSSIYATSEPSKEKIELGSTCFGYMHFDDVVDGSKNYDVDKEQQLVTGKDITAKKASYKQLNQFFGALGKFFLAGNTTNIIEIVKSSKSVGKFEKFLASYFGANLEGAEKHGKLVGCSAQPYLVSMKEWLLSVALEFSKEWDTRLVDSEKTKQVIPLLTLLRREAVGGKAVLELVLLINGIHVDDEIRDTGLFKMIGDLLGIHCQKTNDFCSFDKEMGTAEEWRSNEACLLYKYSGLTKHQALGKLANDANECLEQLEMLFEILIESEQEGGRKQQVEQFVYYVKKCIFVTIRTGVFTKRYHNNLIVDCYIEP